jgi:hypothetical protein
MHLLGLFLTVNLIFTADWELSATDKQFLTAQVQQAHELALSAIRFADIDLAYDPFTAPERWNLNVHLHPSIWVDGGVWVSGMYRPAIATTIPDRIELAWDRAQTGAQGANVFTHELCHYLLFWNFIPGWDVFLHGTNADPPSADLYLRKLLTVTREFYPYGYSSDPMKGVR